MSEDATLVIRVQNTPEDVVHFEQSIGLDSDANSIGISLVAVPGLLAAFVALVLGPFWLTQKFGIAYLLGVGASVIVIALTIGFTYRIYKAVVCTPRYDLGAITWDPFTYTLSSDGLRIEGPRSKYEILWDALRRAVETPTYFYLFVDRRRAYVIPKHVFASKEDEMAFASLLCSHMELETR